jgi:transcriptional regulator with XRE-family HTH domain
MDIDEKESLARTGSFDVAACAIRLIASRTVAGLEQQELASACGVTKSAINNAEAGLSYPSRDVMRYLYKAHRIDYNFILNGDFAQLPGDVQAALFPALSAAAMKWAQKERSNRDREKSKLAQGSA